MRIVAMGNLRDPEEIGDSASSVAFKTPLKILLTIAADQRSDIEYYDYVGAFRITPVRTDSKPIYCWIPQGWPGIEIEKRKVSVFLLKKVLYGLQEANLEFQKIQECGPESIF